MASTLAASAPPPAALRRQVRKARALYVLAIVGAGFVSLAISILIVVGMMPTLAAWFSDRDPNKVVGRCVGFCNAAGLVPPALQLLPYGHNMQQAGIVLQNPVTWIIVLASSGVGWAIYGGVPLLIKAMLGSRLLRRKQALQRNKEKLVEEWGVKVTLDRPELE